MDRNLLHISFEAGMLEDTWYDGTTPADREMYKLSVSRKMLRTRPNTSSSCMKRAMSSASSTMVSTFC